MRLKDLAEIILLKEALPLRIAKEYTSIDKNPNIQKRLDDIFSKIPHEKSSKRGDRIFLPLDAEKTDSTKSEMINSFIKTYGYEITDYDEGLAKDSKGRIFKIGKVLNKIIKSPKDKQDFGKATLRLKAFSEDPNRTSNKAGRMVMVFSKHPYDIAGMSTDRDWTSCMDLYKGSNKHYVKSDVKEGCFVIYLVKSDDLNIKKPVARVIVKPYIDVNDKANVLYSPEERVYGNPPPNFSKTINSILDKVQESTFGYFKLVDTLYCDTSSTISKRSKEQEEEEKRKEELRKREEKRRRELGKKKEEVRSTIRKNYSTIGPYEVLDDLSIKLDSLDIDKIVDNTPINIKHCGSLVLWLVGGPLKSSLDLKMLKYITIASVDSLSIRGNIDNANLSRFIGSVNDFLGIEHCTNIKSLKGFESSATKQLYINNSGIINLVGVDNTSLEDLAVTNNSKLNSLKGCPKKLKSLWIHSCSSLKSLDYLPKQIEGDITIKDSGIDTTEDEIRSLCNVGGKVTLS